MTIRNIGAEMDEARNQAAEQVAFFMTSGEKYVEEFGIEEMDRTQFLGLFAQACVMNANGAMMVKQLESIRTEIEWLTRAVKDAV